MIRINRSYIFFVVLLADLLAIYSGEENFRYVTKPLLIPFLILFFIRKTSTVKTSLKKLIISALFFSWAGDVLLMFETKNENFFIFGLVAFLLAHVFYILFFEKIILREKLNTKYWLFLPVIIYYVVLITVLSPTLEEMKWPVMIYGIVISYMLIKALQTGWIKNKMAIRYLISGAFLFVISDSILALNRFYQPFDYAGIFIMITYGLAQLLIIIGAVRYITAVE